MPRETGCRERPTSLRVSLRGGMPLLLLSLLFSSPLGAAAEKLRVFVSVLPLKTFVQQGGGEFVEVHNLVEPGHSPATYNPTPRQITALAEADLYVRTRVPFENIWMPRILSANPDMPVLDLAEGVTLRRITDHHHASTDAEEIDPHIWTSPLLAQQMIVRIRDKLVELAPAYQTEFTANARQYMHQLELLHAEIKQQLKNLSNRRFMVFHPAWGYFAETYELVQIPIEKQGKAPGARTLTRIIKQARESRTNVIFVQPQFDRKMAQQIADSIAGRVLPIDPLAADYTRNLRKLARLIKEADAHE